MKSATAAQVWATLAKAGEFQRHYAAKGDTKRASYWAGHIVQLCILIAKN